MSSSVSASSKGYAPIPKAIDAATVKYARAEEGYLSFSEQLTLQEKMELFPGMHRKELENAHVIIRKVESGYRLGVMREGEYGWSHSLAYEDEIALIEKFQEKYKTEEKKSDK